MPVYAVPPRPSRRTVPEIHQDFLICGLAASLRHWQPHQFTAFLDWHDGGRDGKPHLPLRIDHRATEIRSWGVEPASVGWCLRFASVAADGEFPGGLMMLAALDPELGPSILDSMERYGQWMALSVGGVEHSFPAEPGDLWLGEVSLVSQVGDQLDPGALVVGHGPGAGTTWTYLTGTA